MRRTDDTGSRPRTIVCLHEDASLGTIQTAPTEYYSVRIVLFLHGRRKVYRRNVVGLALNTCLGPAVNPPCVFVWLQKKSHVLK